MATRQATDIVIFLQVVDTDGACISRGGRIDVGMSSNVIGLFIDFIVCSGGELISGRFDGCTALV